MCWRFDATLLTFFLSLFRKQTGIKAKTKQKPQKKTDFQNETTKQDKYIYTKIYTHIRTHKRKLKCKIRNVDIQIKDQ